jgi:hypothetical protein
MRAIMLRVGGLFNVRIFRNNTGTGWVGTQIKSKPGTITLKDYRPLHAGLCTGSSDLIGWKTIEITPEMVGQRVAVFMAIEVKGPKGRLSAGQRNFIDAVTAAGGVAGIVKSADEAAEILER